MVTTWAEGFQFGAPLFRVAEAANEAVEQNAVERSPPRHIADPIHRNYHRNMVNLKVGSRDARTDSFIGESIQNAEGLNVLARSVHIRATQPPVAGALRFSTST